MFGEFLVSSIRLRQVVGHLMTRLRQSAEEAVLRCFRLVILERKLNIKP